MAGPSLVSTLRHSKFGNVDYKLGLIMVGGTVAGFEPGAQTGHVAGAARQGRPVRSAPAISSLLTLIAWLVFTDIAKKRKKEREARASGRNVDALSTGIEWHKTLHKIKIPPVVHFR